MKVAWLCVPIALAGGCESVEAPAPASRASIIAVDESQRAMVAASDAAGLERLAHANLRINAPGGRVLTRERFLANMRSGAIAAEAFERTAEDVSISGDIAVVMGRETFTPVATSELGRTFGARPLQRRYTNIYVWQDGRWRWIARHANVVPPSAP
ncbi:MAG TPA: nuclear transport factor 2 family protein [Allosphingosinicella sp.]